MKISKIGRKKELKSLNIGEFLKKIWKIFEKMVKEIHKKHIKFQQLFCMKYDSYYMSQYCWNTR